MSKIRRKKNQNKWMAIWVI